MKLEVTCIGNGGGAGWTGGAGMIEAAAIASLTKQNNIKRGTTMNLY